MMQVQCPHCKATYKVDKKKLPDEGANVSCQICQNQFFIKRELNSSSDFTKNHKEKIGTKIKTKASLKECPRCKLPQKGIDECEYCGLIFDEPQFKIKSKNSQSKVRSKKPYVVALILMLIFGTIFTSYRYFITPYLVKRAEEKEKQEIIKAEKADLQNCKKAYLAFMKLEASLESGTNFQNYSNLLSNAKYELNIIKVHSKRYGLFESIYKYYNLAKKIWSANIEQDYIEMCELIENFYKKSGNSEILSNTEFYQVSAALKMEQKFIEEGVKMYPGPKYREIAKFLAQDAQQLIWIEASKGLRLFEKHERLIESQQ